MTVALKQLIDLLRDLWYTEFDMDENTNKKLLSTIDCSDAAIITASYCSGGDGERLTHQQQGYYEFDGKVIGEVLSTFDRDNLTVVDLGCANGEVTASRFGDKPKIGHIFGFDCCAEDIKQASGCYRDDKYTFECVDLDSETFCDKFSSVLQSKGENKADVIFSAFTLQHLSRGARLLKDLRSKLSTNGKIILRGSDDGFKLVYPNSELLSEILTRYSALTGDTSDRYNGRKLYKVLFDAGFQNIQMHFSTCDTAQKTMAEREGLFRVGFGFRMNRIEMLVELNPRNSDFKKELVWFREALDRLRKLIMQEDTWYLNTTVIATAEV